jgi:hypothetical protein
MNRSMAQRRWMLGAVSGCCLMVVLLAWFKPWEIGPGPSERNFGRIHLGMTGQEVLAILGQPTEGFVPLEIDSDGRREWAMWQGGGIAIDVLPRHQRGSRMQTRGPRLRESGGRRARWPVRSPPRQACAQTAGAPAAGHCSSWGASQKPFRCVLLCAGASDLCYQIGPAAAWSGEW